MPYYDHDKDYPFAAFITNLGKYNEGELVGEWVKFPTTAEELKEVFKRIGIGQKDDFGQPYEEWFITDYDCYVDGLYSKLGEYENLDELNYLASKLDEMSESEYAQFQAGMEMGDHCGSLQEIINLTENLDCYEVYPDIHDYDDLGRYYIEELDVMQVPEHLQNYIDYEAYGRDVALEENGTFTDQGYVRDTGDSFHEYYDGERGSIPDEYRVMTFQDDLPEEEKSEWAMDIAFDMDEFFRQNDPQYAAEHPEAHAAKEELYESLMAGRISALDEKLAALGQTQEDYLPSEIEKFKDATGYEEFLDFDPAEVKAALEDPEKSHADEMLGAAERAASEKMTVLVVEPMKEPYVKEINSDLHSLQAEVGGDIGATYPYSDPVALVCNDEGKLIGLDLNRGLRDEDGEIYDIVAGTFLVVGLGEEDFASLPPELIQKYTEQFKTPERFILNVSTIDAACFVRSLCVLVQVVGADSQERNQGFHILQIQSDTVTIQSHFPQIGSHAADAKLVHLLMDSLDLLLGCKEMNILISLCHYNTSSRVSEYFAGGICSALDFRSANTEGRSDSLLSSRFSTESSIFRAASSSASR